MNKKYENLVFYWRNGKKFWFNKALSIKISGKEFRSKGTPGEGKIYKENGYHIISDIKNKNNIREYKTALWLRKNFGGNIILINEDNNRENGVSKPDYDWRGKWWDLKCVSGGLNKISDRLEDAIHQLNNNKKNEPGGVIIDISNNSKVSKADAIAYIKRRLSESSTTNIYVILKKNEKCLAIIKSEKK